MGFYDKFGSVLKCKGMPKVAAGGGEWVWPSSPHSFITPHAQRERGKVIGHGVHIYIYIYVCGRKKNLNRTLEIDSPFQTLTVGLLVEFID